MCRTSDALGQYLCEQYMSSASQTSLVELWQSVATRVTFSCSCLSGRVCSIVNGLEIDRFVMDPSRARMVSTLDLIAKVRV